MRTHFPPVPGKQHSPRRRRQLAAVASAALIAAGVLAYTNAAHAATTTATYVSSVNGTTTTNVTATVLELPSASNSLSTGWYVCNGTLTGGSITVSSAVNANLILADNCNLTLTATASAVTVDGSLTIWSGVNNTGRLNATSTGADFAGIGSSGAIGNLTIRGGSITATGTGVRAAGIGQNGHSYTVTTGSITIQWRANVDARGANANTGQYDTAGPGIGSGGVISTGQASTNAPPVTINTSGLVRATGGASNGTKPAAPNIGNGSGSVSAGAATIPTATVSNPTVTGTGTVQMLNVNQATVAKASVTNVARGSAVTYLATPAANWGVNSAIGNGVNMTLVSTSGNTTRYRHTVAAVPPTTQATSFDFIPLEQAEVFVNGVDASPYSYGDGPLPVSVTGGSGTGTLTLTSSNSTVASLGSVVNGATTLTLNRAGTFTLTGARGTDGTYTERSVTTPTITVNTATPAATLTRTGGESFTDPVNLTMQVNPRGSGSIPQGFVQFYLGSTKLGDPLPLVPDDQGSASVQLNGIPLQNMGAQEVSAEYLGETGKYTSVTKSDNWYLGHMGYCKVETPEA